MRKSSPAFQFYPGDWLSSTKIALMTPAQEGAYLRLLCHAWNDPDCSIPDDDNQLAILSRLGEDWFKGGSQMVKVCFEPSPHQNGRLVNLRLLKEKQKQELWKEKSSIGGRKSVEIRRLNKLKGGSQMVQTPLEPKPNHFASSVPPSEEDPPTPQKKRRTKIGTEVQLSDIQQRQFDIFWKAYPKKDKKFEAMVCWSNLLPNEDLFKQIVTKLEEFKKTYDWQKDFGRWIPMAATWLNNRRWLDESPKPGNGSSGQAVPAKPPAWEPWPVEKYMELYKDVDQLDPSVLQNYREYPALDKKLKDHYRAHIHNKAARGFQSQADLAQRLAEADAHVYKHWLEQPPEHRLPI